MSHEVVRKGDRFLDAASGNIDEVLGLAPAGQVEMGRRISADDKRVIRQWRTSAYSVRAALARGSYLRA